MILTKTTPLGVYIMGSLPTPNRTITKYLCERDTIMDQVNDVAMDIDNTNKHLESMEHTPKKRNRTKTPESGDD